MKLKRAFYLHEDVVGIARALLGRELHTKINGQHTAGVITETEAYAGITDRASHAYGDRRTPRTEIMYAQGGTAYVYLCYGMHSLFNVVTNRRDIPHAVLIRAIRPTVGMDIMLQRCGKSRITPAMTDGPGKLARAMGIHYSMSGVDLCGDTIWIADSGDVVKESEIVAGPRIGVDYAGADALLPYRFRVTEW
jgi:DNA-3-methyladenine glycosylase